MSKIREFCIRLDEEHADDLARMSEEEGEDNELVYLEGLAIDCIDGGWVSCEDEMPEFYMNVLWFDSRGNAFVASIDEDSPINEQIGTVTHWQLIKPPK